METLALFRSVFLTPTLFLKLENYLILKMMNTEERTQRIVGRGEHSNHCHVFVGDMRMSVNEKGQLIAEVPDGGSAKTSHLLETEWLQGKETWTKEHHDIPLAPGYQYRSVQQVEYDPYQDIIVQVRD